MSPADLRLAESELQAMRQIGGAIKFPTQLINDAEGATFSNQQEAQKSVYTNTIIPEMRLLGEGLANWLGDTYYPDTDIRIIPDTTNIEVLQKDKATLASWLVNADFMTQNEKRQEMGLGADPDPAMDDYLIPNGKVFKQDLEIFNDFNDRPDSV
jgi:phage portal protein BeeE